MNQALTLCEGKWDQRLLKLALNDISSDLEIDIFSIEDVEVDNRGKETEQIRQLKTPYYPNDILIKSENGRQFLKRTFAKSIMTFVDHNFNLNLLIDLDFREISQWLEDVEQMASGYTSDVGFDYSQPICDNPDLCGYNCEISIDDRVRSEFRVLGFKENMEEAVGIDKGIHDGDDKRDLIAAYSNEDEFIDAIGATFKLPTSSG